MAAQLAQAKAVVAEYPTVKQALAGGYMMSTVYVPCIGAHYTNIGYAVALRSRAPVRALVRGHEPRLEDRRAELPRVAPRRTAARLRRDRTTAGTSTTQTADCACGAGSWSQVRNRAGLSVRPWADPRRCSPTSGWCTPGLRPSSSAAGASSAASARTSAAVRTERPWTDPTRASSRSPAGHPSGDHEALRSSRLSQSSRTSSASCIHVPGPLT